jgi:ribonuclease HI
LYAIKLRSTPANPVFDTVFNPKYPERFAAKPSAIPTFGIRVKALIADMDVDLNQIQTYRLPDVPIWDMKVPTVLYDLRMAKKSEVSPTDFQSRFHGIQDRYSDHQFIYTDGSKDDNKVGCAAVCGARFLRERLPDTASIYTAELRAIFLAVRRAIYSKRDRFVVCVDSMSCLQAIGSLRIEHPIILEILEVICIPRARQKHIIFCWVPSHVGIRGNERADNVAKAALNDRQTNIVLPYSDHRPVINAYFGVYLLSGTSDSESHPGSLCRIHSCKTIIF